MTAQIAANMIRNTSNNDLRWATFQNYVTDFGRWYMNDRAWAGRFTRLARLGISIKGTAVVA